MSNTDPLWITGSLVGGRYRMEHALGSGGTSTVYRAIHEPGGYPVAVKFLTLFAEVPDTDKESLLEELRREGKLSAELSGRSSAIVQARDMGMLVRPDHATLPYLVLEWLPGATLDSVLHDEARRKAAPRSLAKAIKFLDPIAEAVSVAHSQGVVHRDLKPENIYVLDQGTGPSMRMKLFDFGIAKVMARSFSGLHQTGTMPSAFTPEYGAPEQFSRTYGETGPWTDVYAFALVLLEVALGGQRAYRGSDYMELARQASDEDRRPTPRALGLDVSDDLEAVFARALAVQIPHRYPDLATFREALTGALGGPLPIRSSAPPPGPSQAPIRSSAPPPPRALPVAPAEGLGGRSGLAVWGIGLFGIVAASVFAVARWIRPSEPSPGSIESVEKSALTNGTTAASSVMASAEAAPKAAASTDRKALCSDERVVIAGGRTVRGSDDPLLSGSRPKHFVNVDTFCLDRREVTVERYEACVSKGLCAPSDPEALIERVDRGVDAGGKSACNSGHPERGGHPMNCVNYLEAKRFCEAHGARLPTEAEFELAARRGNELPWVTEGPLRERANLAGTATMPVASHSHGASKEGVFDLMGNVAEWQLDVYAPYPDGLQGEPINPVGPPDGPLRAVRGGGYVGMSLRASSGPVSAAFREGHPTTMRHPALGFRCASALAPRLPADGP